MIRSLSHVLSRVFNVPLLIDEARIDPLLAGLYAARLQRGSELAPCSPAAEGTQAERPPDGANGGASGGGYRIDRGVAILPVRGVLVRRAGKIEADSTPLASYENLTRTLRAARSDSRVRGILLELDSPGGEAGGVFDFAREVRHTDQVKPVWAIANDDALSAAYTIASGARRIWTTETGAAGSLGVVALHRDQSAFDAAEGFKHSYLYKGTRKIDANPHMPLSIEARQQIESEVGRVYDKLIKTVAGHRGMSPAELRATEAAVYFGENAFVARLADHIGTLDEATNALAEHVSAVSRRGTAGMSSEQTDATIESRTDNPPPADAALPDNVVNLIRTTTRAAGAEIAELCTLAGFPDMIAEQIRVGASVETVRRLLQARQVSEAAARQVETIDTTALPKKPIGADIEAAAVARFRAQRTGVN